MNYIDLHTHSTASDGTYTPTELLDYAKEKDLKAIALTDHDTVSGIAEARVAAKKNSIELIPGIELSTEYEGRDIHMLGLNIDTENYYFQTYLKEFKESRDLRNIKMIEGLQKEFDISVEKLTKRYPGRVLTRAHIAEYLFSEGYVDSITDAFTKYIGDNAPYFIPREKITPFDAIRAIHESGGYAILAHPMIYHMKEKELERLARDLKKTGLDGIEAIYSTYRPYDEAFVRRLAKDLNLSITGGSDFHGKIKPDLDLGSGYGRLRVPYTVLENLLSKRINKF